MKLAIFTEGKWEGKVSRDYPNTRTDLAWLISLEADHYNIHNNNISGEYDLGICIIPKQNPQFDMAKIRKTCKKVASMQEGPHWYFQDYTLEKQVWYYNTLQEMDFLFVHNELDKKYFEGLTRKNCIILPSLMLEDSLGKLPEVERSGVIIGGNFCNWYGGFDSYVTAQLFEEEIYVPSMGRKIEGEEKLPRLTHLPFLQWKDWIFELNKRKYAIHLMRTHAAGTFALNCAYLGIPCIGYEGLDTQMICHPDLTVAVGDITSVNEKAVRLRDDKEFYTACTTSAKLMYNNHFREDKFIENFRKNYEKIR